MTFTIDDAQTIRGGEDSAPLVLLLHGYGSNEQDLPSLVPHLPPGLAHASVRAPIAMAQGAYAWVPIGVPGRPDPAVIADSTRALLSWLDGHVAPERVVVPLGFSQGGLMVTQLLRARPDRFAAALVLSGFVLDQPAVGDAALAASGVPVFFGHGDADPIIPADATQRASAWLADHADVTDRTYTGLAHSISADELADVHAFVTSHLG
ncbi:alpha/beta hydrolase [Aeromicrobium fastidiosum]|uniref:Phospholipase n=1 Tax=Aeromicrobium fastidiosum TaxID=52699 RepID=A0A641AJJ6_9ACTN|nr:dienelactone hydrolase family protein [Aeromicrobium fastidiosum]KAA1372508.1 phospholipase [Aeromicrobium fastidiosum]MBP2391409.1 phospholipase/carboxylesterase [Aeromicrobium fastidiosum]